MSDRQTAEDIRAMVGRNKQRGNVTGKFGTIGGRECAEGSARALGMSGRRRRKIADAVIRHGGMSDPLSNIPYDHIGVNDTEGKGSHKTLLGVADKLDGGQGVRRKKADKEAREAERKAKQAQEKAESDARKRPGGSGQKKPCVSTVPEPSTPLAGKTALSLPIPWKWLGMGLGGLLLVLALISYGWVLGVLAVVAMVAGLVYVAWGTRDALPEVNWAYLGEWWAKRQAHLIGIEAQRQEWRELAERDSAPIALGPVAQAPSDVVSASEQAALEATWLTPGRTAPDLSWDWMEPVKVRR